jgi:hypothetical protein
MEETENIQKLRLWPSHLAIFFLTKKHSAILGLGNVLEMVAEGSQEGSY